MTATWADPTATWSDSGYAWDGTVYVAPEGLTDPGVHGLSAPTVTGGLSAPNIAGGRLDSMRVLLLEPACSQRW